jgi:hypothetical protein
MGVEWIQLAHYRDREAVSCEHGDGHSGSGATELHS